MRTFNCRSSKRPRELIQRTSPLGKSRDGRLPFDCSQLGVKRDHGPTVKKADSPSLPILVPHHEVNSRQREGRRRTHLPDDRNQAHLVRVERRF